MCIASGYKASIVIRRNTMRTVRYGLYGQFALFVMSCLHSVKARRPKNNNADCR